MPRDAAPHGGRAQRVRTLQPASSARADVWSTHDRVVGGFPRVGETEPDEIPLIGDWTIVGRVAGKRAALLSELESLRHDAAGLLIYRKPPKMPGIALDLVQLDLSVGGATESDEQGDEQNAHPYSLHGDARAGNGANLEHS